MNKKYCPYCMAKVGDDGVCPICGLTSGTYTPLPHHIPPGTVLMDRYLVGRVLGEGGFGITYIGCDLRLELKVAIKEYFPTNWVSRHSQNSLSVSNYSGAAGSYEKGKSRFLYEARTMAKMDKQPEIVSVRDFFEANNTAYIVMEYVDGTTFKELVDQRGGRIPAGELLHMIEPLFSALSAVHEAGLIHRDISPDNLMLERGSVRLLDFGCARESTQGDETMTITLKHGYAPIEQYQHKGQGPWTDVYGLSATIYYCITGKTPPQALDRLMDDEMILPRRLGVDLTERQEKALLRGMGIKQHQRFRSVEELHTALYEGCDIPAQPEPAPEPEPVTETDPEPEHIAEHVAVRAKKPVGRMILGIVLSLVAVASLIALALMPQTGEEDPDVQGTDAVLVSAEWGDETRSKLFGNARTASSEQELLELLGDSGTEAVILGVSNIGVGDVSLTLSKPLLVPEDMSLHLTGSVTLTEGGVLWLDGVVEGFVIADGGTLVTEPNSVVDGNVVSMTDDGFVKKGGELPSAVFDIPIESLFADAVTVTNYNSLLTACGSASVKAIRIEGDIELAGEVTASVPVLVSEGARLYTEESAGQVNFCLNGCQLVNLGSVECGLWMGGESSVILNRGSTSVNDGLWLDLQNSNDGALINLGEMDISGYNAVFCDVYNYGSINCCKTSEQDSSLGIDIGCLINAGSMSIGKDCWFNLGGELINNGSFEIAGTFENNGKLYSNDGVLSVVSGGRVENLGLIDLYDGLELRVEDGASFRTEDGVLLLRSNCTNYSGNIEGKVWEVDYSQIDTPDTVVSATSEEMLIEALSNPHVSSVRIYGYLELSGSLNVNKALYVTYGGMLSLPRGEQISVESGGIFTVNGSLLCDGLHVTGGGMTEIIGDWNGWENGSAVLEVSNGSWFYSRKCGMSAGSLKLSGGSMAVYASENAGELGSISVSEDSFLVLDCAELSTAALNVEVEDSVLIQLSNVQLSGAAGITVADGAVYGQFGALELLDGAEVGVQSGGHYNCYGSMLNVGSGADFLNEGYFISSGFSDAYAGKVEGSLVNRGELLLGIPLTISGKFDNGGRIFSSFENAPDALMIMPGAELLGNIDFEPWPEG